MAIVTKQEMRMGKKGPLGALLSFTIGKIFALDRANALADKIESRRPERPAEMLLDEVGVAYNVCERDLANVPREGAAIIVSNHPTGALDGIMLIDLLTKIRPDVRFMGNFLLDRISFLRNYFIAVDPFDNPDRAKNLHGMRESIAHLASGGLLVIFPSGTVATTRGWTYRVREFPWSRSAMRFVRHAGCPVVPVFIEVRNSFMFHALGKIHPMLRTAMLPHEMFNKKGRTITINIASPLLPKKAAELRTFEQYTAFLRANVEYLHSPRRRHHLHIRHRKPTPKVPEPIIAPVPRELLREEMEYLTPAHLLFEQANYRVFFAPPQRMPNMLREIGRLREVTFREIGEGSLKEIDTDRYDTYYHQLFVWNSAEEELVGAYRMGMGAEITPMIGLRGFYTDSLFRMDRQMLPVMEKTIELGRSFITKEYQRKPASLMLLWKGILHILLKHTEYRNLMGPVTISGEMDDVSKMLIVRFLEKHHLDRDLARYLHPKTGLKGVNVRIDGSYIDSIDSVDLVNKIVTDIERDEFSIPVLIRKYLQLNSHVLAFNVDPEFNYCLDAMMLLDLKKVPPHTIELLSKEVDDIDVMARLNRFRPSAAPQGTEKP